MDDGSRRTPAQVRAACRAGTVDRPTSGLADGFVQANLMVVPREAAFDFLLFCQRNPKPCPLVEVVEAGTVEPRCAPGADLRTDLPRYRVYRDGRLVEERTEVRALWTDDLVAFLIGCSFSFEEALAPAGVVELTFSGGAAIRLDVECVDAQMRDLGVRWSARHKPGHAIDDAPAEG